MTAARAARLRILLALAVTYVVWGSTYLAIHYAIESIPPFLMAGTRFLTAGAILYAWHVSRGAARPTAKHWRNAAIAGTLLLVGGNGGVTWAEQFVPSGTAALVVATTPVWMVLLVWALPGGVRPRALEAAGIALGLAGVSLLVRPGDGTGTGVEPVGAAVLLLSSLSFAAGSLFTRSAALPESKVLAAGMEMFAAGAIMIGVGLVRGEARGFDPSAVSATSLAALLYLIVFGSLVAFSAYVWLLNAVPPAVAGTYAFVNPAVAVLLGWAIASEPLTAIALAATGIIIAGVALVTVAKDRNVAPVGRDVLEPRGTEPARHPVRSPVVTCACDAEC